jgi:uncharacterized protein YigA (DUF484 family)
LNVVVSPDSGSLSAIEVADYLKQHPGFFEEHLGLLEHLRLPHQSGEAVSLVARQLDLLRDRNQRSVKQLDQLVEIARENDALYQRVHQLTLTLLDAKSLEDVLASLDWGLHQFFQADFVVVRILKPPLDSAVQHLFVAEDAPEADWLRGVIARAKPLCGRPDPDTAGMLFGKDAPEVASQAVLKLDHAGLRGVFAIGSRDSTRLRADMGVVFLTQMSEILAARLAALLYSTV